MPDICMCSDKKCPKRKKCYRFTARPSEWNQSYFSGSPREGKKCEYFNSNKLKVVAKDIIKLRP